MQSLCYSYTDLEYRIKYDPTYPFRYFDSDIPPTTEVDHVIRKVIEYKGLVKEGYRKYKEIMAQTGWTEEEVRRIKTFSDMNIYLLLAIEVNAIPPDLALLLDRMEKFCGEEYMDDLIRKLKERKLDREQVKENAKLVLDHHRELRRKLDLLKRGQAVQPEKEADRD